MGKKRSYSDNESGSTLVKKHKAQSSLETYFKSPKAVVADKKKKTPKSDIKKQSATSKEVQGKGKAVSKASGPSEIIDLSSGDEEDSKPVASTSKLPVRTVKQEPKVKDELLAEDSKPALPKNMIGFAHNSSKDAAVQSNSFTCALDKDILQFDPNTDVDASNWATTKTGTKEIPYSFLTAAFVLISSTRSRLIIVTVMTNTLRTIVHYQPECLLSAVYLITNHVAPAYEGVELGLGSQVLTKALKDVSGISSKELSKLWNQHGGPLCLDLCESILGIDPAFRYGRCSLCRQELCGDFPPRRSFNLSKMCIASEHSYRLHP